MIELLFLAENVAGPIMLTEEQKKLCSINQKHTNSYLILVTAARMNDMDI